ncbi:unnamed protein product [Cyprideis torosa]|uniref:Uncharacterized protein n=1 Tax=Cyprideis torosa TaxID=163714 RepID=A0A7R8W4K2_9CRUS|nr:unnamed protein product [Cyprideis torosa]CAG0884137.1 unnamed protein product [Cyprideis torosa]
MVVVHSSGGAGSGTIFSATVDDAATPKSRRMEMQIGTRSLLETPFQAALKPLIKEPRVIRVSVPPSFEGGEKNSLIETPAGKRILEIGYKEPRPSLSKIDSKVERMDGRMDEDGHENRLVMKTHEEPTSEDASVILINEDEDVDEDAIDDLTEDLFMFPSPFPSLVENPLTEMEMSLFNKLTDIMFTNLNVDLQQSKIDPLRVDFTIPINKVMKEGYLKRFIEDGKIESGIFYDLRKYVQVRGSGRAIKRKRATVVPEFTDADRNWTEPEEDHPEIVILETRADIRVVQDGAFTGLSQIHRRGNVSLVEEDNGGQIRYFLVPFEIPKVDFSVMFKTLEHVEYFGPEKSAEYDTIKDNCSIFISSAKGIRGAFEFSIGKIPTTLALERLMLYPPEDPIEIVDEMKTMYRTPYAEDMVMFLYQQLEGPIRERLKSVIQFTRIQKPSHHFNAHLTQVHDRRQNSKQMDVVDS